MIHIFISFLVNMKEMFTQIAAIGTDTLSRGTKQTGSILIESMTVAGG